jgi:hypothetical protein
VIALALVSIASIGVFAYLYWREQGLRVEMLREAREERAQLADRIQMPEVVIQERAFDGEPLAPMIPDMGPWADPTPAKKD